MRRRWCADLMLLTGILALASCKTKTKTLFTELEAAETGITFSNRITENDSINIIDNEYVYNGGGVAISDFNRDGLQDIYFTGNMVSNRLFINKGGFKFNDVSSISGTSGEGRWCSGVAVVDINQDSLPDLYVCATFKTNPGDRANMLYVNQGSDKNGVPIFKEMAAEYGIADTTQSTNAAFFDYDNDGDLDLYILVDRLDPDHYPNKFHTKITDGTAQSTGRLYRNDWSDSLHHPYYTNVSKEAGITTEGFGLGVHICDINQDGWQDIYVTNDYITNDLLYINNGNGTFTNRASEYFKHTSFSAMGNDVADLNNDGLQDIIAVDMLPEDNFRKKMMVNPNNYSFYLNTREFNYDYQYVRNTVQLNMGFRPVSDSNRNPMFGDIAYYSGLSSTDWSWTPLVADFDNDGYRDVIITNGFPRDVTDQDFKAYRMNTRNYAPKGMVLEQVPSVKLKNYAYHNNGDLTFSNVTDAWGITKTSFSSGAAYADLDNDGDLDYVVNNIDDSASVFRNDLYKGESNKKSNYLRLSLVSDQPGNAHGLGAFVEIKYGNGKTQVHEQTPYRGYLSTMEPYIHFGLGADTIVDYIKVTWPGGLITTMVKVKANQLLAVPKTASWASFINTNENAQPVLRDVTATSGIQFVHQERDYIDFNIQKLLPHKFSQYGPAIAAGDINGDGLDDFFVSGSFGYSGKIFIQKSGGGFTASDLIPSATMETKEREDAGALLFDADNDGDLDLYIAGGGYESRENTDSYGDQLYINDGKGKFTAAAGAIPLPFVSKSCIKAADYDKDGDLDLFVGGRVLPGKYPSPVSSFILRNDSKDGKPRFTDVTKESAPMLSNIGLTCDMLWTDYDNDGWFDIMLTGEWMPVTLLKNNKGKFENITTSSGLDSATGWWNSLVAGDFDNDGDIDYVAGNVGMNSYFKASKEHPAGIYAADFNKDGGFDAIPTIYLPAVDGSMKEFPAFGRDDMIKQMITIKGRFTNYHTFAKSTISEILTKEEIEDAIKLKANTFASCFIRNMGNGKFTYTPLPLQAQLSSVYGMIADDVDGDNNLDLVINGNDYGTEIGTGRYDAFNGLVLKGDGKGNFKYLLSSESGLVIPGDGKSLVRMRSANDKTLILAGQNQGPLLVFEKLGKERSVPLTAADVSVQYNYNNGMKRKEELYFGTSFYSQSGRYISVGPGVKSIVITDREGKTRNINF